MSSLVPPDASRPEPGSGLVDERDGAPTHDPARVRPVTGAPIQTGRATLATFPTAELSAILLHRRAPGWHPDFPRGDDVDAIRAGVDDGPWAARGIRDRATGLIVGTIGCVGRPGSDGLVEVGYGLVRAARGAGLMTDVLAGYTAALLASGVGVLARTEPGNIASERVLARCGFVRVGREPAAAGGFRWRWQHGGPGAGGRS